MSNRTTVAHLILEHLEKQGISLPFPEHSKGDLVKERDWAMSTSGFNLISNFQELFDEVCEDVDDLVSTGKVVFTEDGILIFHDQKAKRAILSDL